MKRIGWCVAVFIAIGAPAAADVTIKPGADLQAAVNANPAGTTFQLTAGVYRYAVNGGRMVTPKAGNTFIGQPGTIISGARVLTGWAPSGTTWYVTGQTQRGQPTGICEAGVTGCTYPEDLFFNNVPKTHVRQLALVVPGTWYFDYDAATIYVGDDPSGQVVETSVARHAFVSGAANVTIRGLIIEKFAVPAQWGAVYAADYASDFMATGWVVENCEIRLNHGAGIRTGHAMVIRLSNIHDNGNIGISGLGTGILIESNTIAFNNYAKFAQGWEAGGVKIAQASRLTVRCNQIVGNKGPGLWCDGDCTDAIWEYNSVHDNEDVGMFYEISWGTTVIRHNVAYNNGLKFDDWLYGAQIMVSTSSDVEVYGNIVAVRAGGKGNGITIVEQDRGASNAGLGTWVTRNNYVHDNDVSYYSEYGLTGLAADNGDLAVFAGSNRFDNNHYHVVNAPAEGYSRWAYSSNQSWAGFKAQGQEFHGSADTVLPAFPPGSSAGGSVPPPKKDKRK